MATAPPRMREQPQVGDFSEQLWVLSGEALRIADHHPETTAAVGPSRRRPRRTFGHPNGPRGPQS